MNCVTIMLMAIILCLRWWYSSGWQWAWHRSVTERVAWCMSAFSISALVRTWFSPFKQTYSAGRKGSIDAMIQGTVDNFVSRIIGGIARTIIILTGLACMALAFISGVIIVVVWPVLPVLPIIAIGLAATGAGA